MANNTPDDIDIVGVLLNITTPASVGWKPEIFQEIFNPAPKVGVMAGTPPGVVHGNLGGDVPLPQIHVRVGSVTIRIAHEKIVIRRIVMPPGGKVISEYISASAALKYQAVATSVDDIIFDQVLGIIFE